MNGATLAQYTSLESLLFFQALRSHDLSSINFGQLSRELNNVPLIRHDAAYNIERLSPDSLKNLYLGLVKEEARRDLDQALRDNEDGPNGGLSPRSRKRKAPSPSVPTVEDAARHSHLLPKLLLRLYTQFREATIARIREDEREYDRLNDEIDDIERGDWDERLQEEQARQIDGGQRGSAKDDGAHIVVEDLRDGLSVDGTRAASRSEAQSSDQRVVEERPLSARASIDALVNHTPVPDNINATPRPRKPSANVTSLPPLSEMAPEDLGHAQSPASHRLPQQHMNAQQMPPQAQQSHGYQASSPMPPHSPYAPQYQHPGMAQGPSPSPKLQNSMASQSPSSPRRMLPLPPGMKMSVSSPVMQNGTAGHGPPQSMQPPPYGSPNQRLPSVPMPTNDRQNQRGFPAPPHLPTPPGYPQQSYPQYQNQQPYPQHHQPHHQQQQGPGGFPVRPSQQGGYQLPPFQVASQEPSRMHQQQYAQQQNTPQQGRPPYGSPSGRGPPPQTPYGQYSPYPQPPQPRVEARYQPDQLTAAVLDALRKRSRPTWRLDIPRPSVRPNSPSRPAVEPMSPVGQRAVLQPVSNGNDAVSGSTRRRSARDPQAAAAQAEQRDPLPPPKSAARRQSRRTRGESVASSVVASSTRGRTRSQSVVSQLADTSTPAERQPSGRKVKNEPSTPAPDLQDDETADFTPAAGRVTRNRRSTIQSQVQSAGKRKRPASSEEDGQDGDAAQAYVPPSDDMVYVTRNFQKLSAVILDDINTHKHASPFKKPVLDKDVEGYKDIIKRPQDLKSIKAAITAGSRAIAAATSKDNTDSPATTPAKDGGQLMLEKTIDLIPPKAIVNSSQLEKEVMRMFANAVMFNPGEVGFVEDARKMQEDIEAKVRDWRGVERQHGEGRGGDEEEETGGGGGGGSTAKRRKL